MIDRRGHDAWCCDERDRPHIHIGQLPDGRWSWRLGHAGFTGPALEGVLDAAAGWLEENGDG